MRPPSSLWYSTRAGHGTVGLQNAHAIIQLRQLPYLLAIRITRAHILEIYSILAKAATSSTEGCLLMVSHAPVLINLRFIKCQ
jgi:hypothetical protein